MCTLPLNHFPEQSYLKRPSEPDTGSLLPSGLNLQMTIP
jgi:hypothetical protein